MNRLAPWIFLACLNGIAWLFFARQKADALDSKPPAAEIVREAVSPAVVTNVIVQTNSFEWSQLESEDYRTYIARLRSIGCPEETINDIIIADLEKLMASRVREIEGSREPPLYWKPSRKDLTSTIENLERLGKKQEVDFEKREFVRELLGIDLASERARTRGESDFYDERLGFLDAEKRTRVRIAIEKANQEELLLREKSWLENDTLTAEERARLRAIQNRKDAEIAALLSPAEKEQFDLWFSPSAYRVRDAFLALEPSESEFLALYNIQREFDSKWGSVEPAELSPAQKREYTASQQQRDQALLDHLGPDKFQKYQHAHDSDFRQLQSTAVQFGLRPDVTSEIYDYRAALQEERENIKNNKGLNAVQKAAILQALSEETEHAVVEALGPKAYKYYLRQGAGAWIYSE